MRPQFRAPGVRRPLAAAFGLLAATTGFAQTGTYVGRDANAAWRAPAAARIEQLRKGDFAVRVVDAAGRPLPSVTVTIAQQRHAFPFGSALVMSRLIQDNATNRTYRQKALSLFNAGTTENDLKWPPWLGEWGAGFDRNQTLAGLRWLRDRGVAMRGHVFVWPGWSNLPLAITALRGTPRQSEIPQLVLEHIAEQAAATRELVPEWDVLNEPFSQHDLMDVFGQEIMVDWFKAARAALPAAQLYLNDFNNHNQVREAAHVRENEATLRFLQQRGAPLDGFGIQAHIGANPDSITDVLATLARYDALGLTLRITEFDINTTDETLQADYTRDFMTAAFSHPTVVGFQFWGFWAGAHWRPNAAMYRTDWSEKPAGAAYRALVFEQWWTRLTLTTDANGVARGRGFFGDYVASLTAAGGAPIEKTFSLRAGPGGTAAATPPTPPTIEIVASAPRIANLSARAFVGGAAEPPVAGFVIEGAVAKRVLVRASGPALAGFGLSDALARPVLTAFREGRVVAANTGWSTAANASEIAAAATAAGAFAFAAGSADSAAVLTLAPGAYTARVTSADGGSGVALIEVFELGSEAPRFANVSTRAFVGTGASILIPGLVVRGESARTFLIRGVGPGLTGFGVAGALARPSLVVMHGNTPVAANDHWETAPDPAALADAARRVGAFPLAPGSADAALLVTLEPAAYTVLISGANAASGNCLVEIYEVAR